MHGSAKTVVYGTPFCRYCRRAEALLEEKGIPYDWVDVSADPEAREALVERAHGRRTVPVIFIGDRLVGGYDELAALARSGELEPLVQSAGADVVPRSG